MANAWIEHIKSFAEKHNMSYKDALKNPQCKASYHQLNGGSARKDPITGKTIIGNRFKMTPEEMKRLLEFEGRNKELNGGKLWLKPKEEELEEVRGNKYINSSRDLPEPPFGYFYYNGKLCKNKRVYAKGGYFDKYGMPKLDPEVSIPETALEAIKRVKNKFKKPYIPPQPIEGGFRPLTQKQFHSLPPKHQHHHIQLAHHHHLAGGKVPKWLQKIGNFAKDVGNKIKDTAVKIGQNPTIQKIGNVAKEVGKKAKKVVLQIENNPMFQRMGREALYLLAPPLRFADPAIKVVQEHATNELVKALGEEGRADLEGQGRIMWKPSKKLTEEEYKAQGYRPETETDRWTKSIKKYHPEDATTEDGRRLIYKGIYKGGADSELFARLRIMIDDASRHGVKITMRWVKENAIPHLQKSGAKMGERATSAILDWARSVQYGNEISVPDIGANWEDVEEEPDYDIIDKDDYEGSGRNPYEHLKKGAFTRDLNAFNKKHGKNVDLEGFAMLIAKHPTSFKPLERKRALFYLNLIKHKPTHLKGGRDISKDNNFKMNMNNFRRKQEEASKEATKISTQRRKQQWNDYYIKPKLNGGVIPTDGFGKPLHKEKKQNILGDFVDGWFDSKGKFVRFVND